jgi:uncharacterized membrane protein YeaQ/YmgE (transglycosylase-associated protein family)
VGILAWIGFGLVAGLIARWLNPEGARGGIITTILIGIGGAMLGGYLGSRFLGIGDVTGFNLPSLGLAVGGALLLLVIYEALVKAKILN